MAGTTSNFGWPYPTSSDSPNGAAQIAALAVAADASLKTTNDTIVANALASKTISDTPVTANSSNTSGTAKTIWVSRTVSLVSGIRYRVTFDTGYDVGTVSTIVFEMHYIAGGSATLTGATKFYGRYQRAHTSGAFLNSIGKGTFVAPSTGTFTIMGALWNPDSAVSKTNGGTPNASDNQGRFIIEQT